MFINTLCLVSSTSLPRLIEVVELEANNRSLLQSVYNAKFNIAYYLVSPNTHFRSHPHKSHKETHN